MSGSSVMRSDQNSQGDSAIIEEGTNNLVEQSSYLFPKQFPNAQELYTPIGDGNLPKIVLEDWTDQSYYDFYQQFIEDKAGSGIYRIIENHPPCLKINGTVYSSGLNIFNYPKVMTNDVIINEIIFDECYTKEMKFNDLEFENVGPYAIRYEWRKIRLYEKEEFPIKYHPNQEYNFYFDSRPGILVPGEIRKFCIGLKSKFTGICKEDWKFIAVPAVHKNEIIFKFRGLSGEKVLNEPWKRFDNNLKLLQARNCALDILNYTLRKVFEIFKPVKGPEGLNYVDEELVFTCINGDMFSYNQNIVDDLKETHFSVFKEKWNLNLLDFEEKLNSSMDQEAISVFKKYKIKLMKLDQNIYPRKYYVKYNEAFQMLGETINDIQAIIEKCRTKHGLKQISSGLPPDNQNYFHFPLSFTDLNAIPKETENDKKEADKEKKDVKKGKTDEGAKSKGKKVRDLVELVPKQPFIIRPKEWKPENNNYRNDIYENINHRISMAIDSLVNILENHQEELPSKIAFEKNK